MGIFLRTFLLIDEKGDYMTDYSLKCMEMEQYRSKTPRGMKEFQRPLYEYTSIENRTIAEIHKDDWKKKRRYGDFFF